MVRKAKRVAAAVLAAITALTPVLGHVPVQAGADGGNAPDAEIVQGQAAEPVSGEIRVRVGEGGTVSVTIGGTTKEFSSEDGTVTESKDGGVREAAAVDSTGAALAFTANEGEIAHVEVLPAGGYEVAKYAVESDAGPETNETDVWVHGTKTISVTFEKIVDPDAVDNEAKTAEQPTVTESTVTESKADAATESKTEDATESKSEDATESKSGDATESKTDNTAESKTDDAAESKANDTDKSKTEETTESKKDDAAESKTESGTESKANDVTESKTDKATESKADDAVKPRAENVTESKTESDTESNADDAAQSKANEAESKADGATESPEAGAKETKDATVKDAKADKAKDEDAKKADESQKTVDEESDAEDVGLSEKVNAVLSDAVFLFRVASDVNELLAGAEPGGETNADFRDSETIKLKYGVAVAYGEGNNGTQMYMYERTPQERETSSTYAYCVRPDLHVADNNATFTTNLMDRDSAYLYRIMYHSFGAPGWEAAKKFYAPYLEVFRKNGQSDDMTYYAICHVVLSYSYTLYSEKRSLGWATSESWKKGLTAVQRSAIQDLYSVVKSIENLPAAPANFAVYSTRGNGYQDMLYWVTRKEQPKGTFRIKKVSGDPNTTDGNAAYSLVGTQFNIYDGYEIDDDGNYTYKDATLVATVTVKEDKGGKNGGSTETIELPPGTYYAAEVKAGKGYMRRLKPTKFVVKSGQDTESEVKNYPEGGKARVQKVAKNLDAAQALGATLKGIVYRLYETKADAQNKRNHLGRNLYVQEDGYSNYSSELPYGTYWWREVKTNDYFELSDEIGQVTISAKNPEATFKAEDDIAQYYIKVHKFSEDESLTKGNKNYSLKGAVYGLYKTKAEAKTATIDNQGNPIKILTTDAEGKSDFVKVVVGTYYLVELAPSPGFLLNTDIEEVVVNSDTAIVTEKGNSLVWVEVEEPIKTPYVRVMKESSNKDVTEGNPCYSLKGATYALYKTKKEADAATAKKDGNPIARFVCGADGRSNAPKVPYGQYYLKELVPGKNYKLSEESLPVTVSKETTHVTESGNELLIVYVEDKPAMDPVRVEVTKVDAENAEPIGSLEGARFTIKYYAAEGKTAKQLESMEPARTWVIETKTVSATQAKAQLDTDWLVAGSDKLYKNDEGQTAVPVGMLVIEETQAPAQYTVKDVKIRRGNGDLLGSKAVLSVVKDEEVAIIEVGHEFTVEDSPRRGDLKFTKVGPNGEKLANVMFRLDYYGDNSDGSVLESHIIMTDADGFYSSESSYAKHSHDTNGGKAGSGTWFGNIKALDDTKGALPAGHYRIQELRSAANQGYKMIAGKFAITKDGEVQVPKDGTAYHDPEVTVDTEAKDVLTGTNYAEASGSRKFSDTVTMKNLEVGAKYRLVTMLMDKGGRKPAQSGGKDVRAEKEFTADAEEMSVDVEVTIETDGLNGRDLVFFETLYMLTSEWATDGFDPSVPAAKHEDYDDEKQTIHMLGISTTLKTADGSKSVAMPEADAQGNYPVSLIDAVSYSGLEAGAGYVAEGELMDKSTGKAFHDANGTAVTASQTFTAADGGKGVVDVKFDFVISAADAKRLQDGGALVSFQTVKRDGKEVATHKDMNDAEQTVEFPSVKTTAVDAESGTKTANADTNVRIKDRVDYTGLMPGKKYTVTGKLYDKATGKPVVIGGKEVTASKDFTAPALTDADIAAGRTLVSGSVEIEFVFDGTGLEGHAIVAFEDLYEDGRKFATHADINDDNQTVYLPKVRTTLTEAGTGSQLLSVGHTHKLTDHVEYEMLRPNSLYLLEADLVDKADGKSVITGKVKLAFVTGSEGPASGTADVPVSVEVTESLVNHKLVCTETLYALGDADMDAYGKDPEGYVKAAAEGATPAEAKVVGSHADLNDADQTVSVPGVSTDLRSDNGTHTALAKTVTLTDIVRYTDLVPGKTYTATAQLYNKKDGKPLAELDPVTVSFTAPELTAADIEAGRTLVSGKVEVPITVDLSKVAGERVVCVESVREDDIEVAVHHDLEDEDQTVDVPVFATVLATADGEKLVKEGETVTLVDTLSYKTLRKGDTYTVWTYAYAVDAEGNVTALGEDGLVATTELTAQAADGSIDVSFDVDTTGLGNGSIACLEKVTVGSADSFDETKLVGEHGGIGDKEQTVTVPVIETKLTGTEGTHIAPAGIVTLTDVVTYNGLIPGKTYTATAQLYDQKTGDPVPEAGPVAIEFTAPDLTEEDKAAGRTTVSGQVEVPVTVDLSAIAGRKVVCFEDVDEDGRTVAVHHDINDREQTVNVPKFDTLLATAEGGKLVKEGETTKVKDVLSYWNLVEGDTYTTWAYLFATDGKGGYEPLSDGPVAAVTFVADAEDGDVEVAMSLDATGLGGRRIVCQEKVTVGGQEDGLVEDRVIGTHGALDDEDQSVHVPTVETELTGTAGTHTAPASSIVELTDTVRYTGLIPGKRYTATAQLYDQETGKALKGVEPKTIEFVAPELTDADIAAGKTTVSGEVAVPLTVSPDGLAGKSIVCFEDIEHEGRKVAIHHDIKDKSQTVHIPAFATELLTTEDGKLVPEGATVELIDTVSYRNVEPGCRYTVWTFLTSAEDTITDGSGAYEFFEGSGKFEFKSDAFEGKEYGKDYGFTGFDFTKIIAATEFVAETSNGSVSIPVIVDTTGLGGKRIVCGELITVGGSDKGLYESMIVGGHADPQDAEQSVFVPTVNTEAVDKASGTHMAEGSKKITIVDRVDYTNLIPGKEYEVKGTLYDKDTKKPFLVNGKEVTASRKFKAPAISDKDLEAGRTSVSGSVELEFTFDGAAALGKTIVAFEDVYEEHLKVATHADIDDEDQTVYIPKVDTVLAVAGTGAKRVSCREGSVLISDTVTYKNFIPGRKYVAKASIYDRTTGKMTGVTGQTAFTPDTSDGAVSVDMTINVSALAGHTIVCFETVYDDETGKPVASHNDPDDAAQAIDVYDVPQTGDVPYMTIAFIIGGVALLAGIAVLVIALAKRRKKGN